MRLGQTNPEWVALRKELARLVMRAAASNVYVLDAWGNLWCSGEAVSDEAMLGVIEIAEAVLQAQKPVLQRGGKIDRIVEPAVAHGYARSFSSAYLVLVLFAAPVSASIEAKTRASVNAALPRIQALTIALPLPEGPGSGGAEGFGAA